MAFSLRTRRLLLREWRDDDRAPFARMSEDPAVMEMLLPMDRAASDAWITQMQAHYHKHGFCQWAVELPGEVSLIGCSRSELGSSQDAVHTSGRDGLATCPPVLGPGLRI
jgi:RimJ/RimL family protein N-acetyltransferase